MLCHGRIAQLEQGQGHLEQLPWRAVPCSPGVTMVGHLRVGHQGLSEVVTLRLHRLRSDKNPDLQLYGELIHIVKSMCNWTYVTHTCTDTPVHCLALGSLIAIMSQ